MLLLSQSSMDSKLSAVTQQRDRLQRYLTHAVTSRALDKTKSDWLNLLTMRFHHSYREKRVSVLASFVLCVTCS